jgi:fucose permease
MSINRTKLFNASCMALVVTSMTFAIRAGMVEPLGKQFNLTDTELAQIVGMAFFGFPVATTLGGFLVDALGMKRFMMLAFGAHLLGLVLTIFAGGYWTLMISTFLVGFANGTVEAVCNPLIASMYPDNKTTMLNKFHVWFPGGIVIGSILSYVMTNKIEMNLSDRGVLIRLGAIILVFLLRLFGKDRLSVWVSGSVVALALLSFIVPRGGLDWHYQVATILIPTLIYAYMFFGEEFPETERVTSGVSMADMFKACASPLFIFMMACMFLTANTELTTTQWVGKLLGNVGADPLLILALVTGLMAVGRYFGGPLIHRLNPTGVLLMSAVLSVLGIFWLKQATGGAVYAAAIVFALGVCYFWPTMLGYVSESMPKTGALGLSLMGGAGMFGNWAYQTFFIGPKLDQYKAAETAKGVTDTNLIDLAAGQQVLSDIGLLPIILVVAFAGLYFFMKKDNPLAKVH